MKCVVCKSGNMVVSGSHEYCDNCNFARFIVTENYIDSCIIVLSALASNTAFESQQHIAGFIRQNIIEHLPKLNSFLNDIAGNGEAFMAMVTDGVLSQGINIQLGTEHINAQEERNDLQCSCGSKEFIAGEKYPSQIQCEECQVLFIYNHERGIYEPEFICECGCFSWELLDDITGLSECIECHAAYIHNASENTFTRVTE